MPRSELRFFILFPGGLFAFYGLYQFYSANPTFLRRTFQNRVRNPAEPFAAEISVPVIGVEIANPIFPVGRTTVRTHIDNAAKKAGVKRIRIHDFRHSHASLLIERNEPINLVADRLGHENPSITLKTYSHVYSARNKKLAEDLDKSIGEISICLKNVSIMFL